MKKSIYLLIAILLVLVIAATFALTACDKNVDPEENKGEDVTPGGDPAAAVTWGEWETVADATCTAAGLETRESSEGQTESRAIPAKGHTIENGVCKVCGISITSDAVYAGLTYGEDYKSLYDVFGKKVSIADVEEAADGKAYIYVKGEDVVTANTEGAVKKELGMDFLSMAMVYNVEVPESWEGKTADDVYAEWWKLYIQRWNYLLPEVPLYSNEYYDVYNKKLGGVAENPTNPYWGPANALIDWTSSDDNIILGNSTDLSGKFRYSSFGANNPGAADNDVAGLVSGLATVCTTKEGGYVVDPTVVKSFVETDNADGTTKFEIEIYDDLKYSDGSAIKAKDYIVNVLVFSSPVAAEAAGKDHKAGMSYVGYKAFAAYNGTNAGEEKKKDDGTVEYTVAKEFSGIRLLGDYKFSVTVSADYAGYFYKVAQAAFSPNYLKLWIGDYEVKDDGNGVYLSDGFYAKAEGKYTMAAHIKASAANTDTTYPYSGAYVVKSYDKANKTATLEKNTNYKGNYEGKTAGINTVVYKKIISATQLADFKAGGVDVLSAITGGDATDEAVAYAKGADGTLGTADDQAILTHYSRAGYGKLGFRADFGPVQFTAVRQAIAYCLDRPSFAQQFTGGYGGVVDGPYYNGGWMYLAVKDDIILNQYTPNLESAKAVLVADGWIYNADGEAYTTGVRYKKIAANEMKENDKTYAAKDGSYETIAVYKKGTDGKDTDEVDYYLMPLALNWFGTVDNEFSDILVKDFVLGTLFKQAGFVIKYSIGDFAPMLDELYQAQVYGYYGGTPTYTCFNFATSFNSAVYDYAYNWTIDPAMYEDYSICYVKDSADYYLLTK